MTVLHVIQILAILKIDLVNTYQNVLVIIVTYMIVISVSRSFPCKFCKILHCGHNISAYCRYLYMLWKYTLLRETLTWHVDSIFKPCIFWREVNKYHLIEFRWKETISHSQHLTQPPCRETSGIYIHFLILMTWILNLITLPVVTRGFRASLNESN